MAFLIIGVAFLIIGVASSVIGVSYFDYRGRRRDLDMERQREGNSETLARAGGSGTSKPPPERVFFIVDRSRLKEETDEFKDAVVVYIPDGDLKKVWIYS